MPPASVSEVDSAKAGHPVLPIFELRASDVDTSVRTCSTCKKVKPLNDFPFKREELGWRQRRCKACAAAIIREKRALVRVAPDPGGQPCAWCEKPCPPAQLGHPPRKFCTRDCAYSENRTLRAPARMRKRVLSAYGLTIEAYEAMAIEQGHQCAICRSYEPYTRTGVWHVDHCHATGAVRALLCSPCNVGLGSLKDDPARLRAAADYLEMHQARIAATT
jgi:hypothetical protein